MGCSDMRLGFSTGALAAGDVRAALTLLEGTDASAIELSALRCRELRPLLDIVGDLQLDRFSYVAVHAPSSFHELTEADVVQLLEARLPEAWNIIVHPDSLTEPTLWRSFGSRLCLENMDKRKTTGRTARELDRFFDCLPEASLCLDLAHVRQIDPSMSHAVELIHAFRDRIVQLHVSDLDASAHHVPLTTAAILAFQEVVPLLPRNLPIIIESVISADGIDRELTMARRALGSRIVPALAG